MLAKFDDSYGELESAIGNALHFKEKGKRKKEKFIFILLINIAKNKSILSLFFPFYFFLVACYSSQVPAREKSIHPSSSPPLPPTRDICLKRKRMFL